MKRSVLELSQFDIFKSAILIVKLYENYNENSHGNFNGRLFYFFFFLNNLHQCINLCNSYRASECLNIYEQKLTAFKRRESRIRRGEWPTSGSFLTQKPTASERREKTFQLAALNEHGRFSVSWQSFAGKTKIRPSLSLSLSLFPCLFPSGKTVRETTVTPADDINSPVFCFDCSGTSFS